MAVLNVVGVNKVTTLWNREPVAIVAAVQALLAVAVGFGLALDAEQVALILAAVAAVLGLLTRSRVSSPATVAGSEPPTYPGGETP